MDGVRKLAFLDFYLGGLKLVNNVIGVALPSQQPDIMVIVPVLLLIIFALMLPRALGEHAALKGLGGYASVAGEPVHHVHGHFGRFFDVRHQGRFINFSDDDISDSPCRGAANRFVDQCQLAEQNSLFNILELDEFAFGEFDYLRLAGDQNVGNIADLAFLEDKLPSSEGAFFLPVFRVCRRRGGP